VLLFHWHGLLHFCIL